MSSLGGEDGAVRVRATRWNFISGAGAYILVLLLSFITRTVFVRTLGEEHLGLYAVLLNAVAIVSVAEAGVATAVMYRLYRPLAEGSDEAVAGWLSGARTSFRWAFIFIVVIGAVASPIIVIAASAFTFPGLAVLGFFWLTVGQALAGCVFATEKALLLAGQRQYIAVMAQCAVLLLQSLIQVCILQLFGSFAGFLAVQALGTLAWNAACRVWAYHKYPRCYFNDRRAVVQSRFLGSDLRSLFPYKLGAVGLNATDGILISVLLNVALAGLVSNFLLIINSLNGVLMQAFNGLAAAIGVHNVEADRRRRTAVFYQLTTLSIWMFGSVAVCLLLLLNPFVVLWLGSSFALSRWEVLGLVAAFYVAGINQVPSLYRTSLGLFRNTRLVPLVAAFLNIVLSVVLARVLGLAGVFLATVLSRGLTFSLIDPVVVSRASLSTSPAEFFLRVIRSSLGVGLLCGLGFLASDHLRIDSYWAFALMGLISVVVSPVALGLWLCMDRDFRKLLQRLAPTSLSRSNGVRQAGRGSDN